MNARITQSYWRTAPVYETARTRRTSREHITTAEERTRRSWSQSREKISAIPISEEAELKPWLAAMAGVGAIAVIGAAGTFAALMIHYFGFLPLMGCVAGAGMIRWGAKRAGWIR